MQAFTDFLGQTGVMVAMGLCMVAMPFVLVGGIVWLVIRSNRKKK